MITEQSPSRKDIEQALIGCCLNYSSAYGQLANILSPMNFTKWIHNYDEDYPLVWKIFGEMYPTKTIDLFTVTHYGIQYHNADPSAFRLHMAQASHYDIGPARMWTYAYLLLEYDIQNKFCALLLSIGSQLSQDDYATAKAAIIECHDIVKHRMQPDVLFAINGLVLYLKQVGVPEEGIERCNEFVAAIDEKLEQRKKQAVLDTILVNLNHYGNLTDLPETKTALKQLFEITRILCNNQNATKQLNSQLTYLKQELTKA